MLKTIESVLTKRANPVVHRMNFGNLTQHESESILVFLVRIRTLAIDCEFSCPTCSVNISAMHIRDQFIRGLHNLQLQTDILAKACNFKTVKDIVKHAEAFETALRDQSQFQHSADVLAARASPYRKQKQQNFPPNKTYNGCGSKDHGIIAPVPIGSPVSWCSSMVVLSKEDGSPRRTIDFQRLNAQCQRETHHTSTPFQLASQVPAHTKKSVVDAVDGFHYVALDSKSQPLTTFITEWGRFMYLRMPQGFVVEGDAYTRRYDEIIDGVERKVKIVDDTLLYDKSNEQAFYHMWDYLTLCANNGVVVNAKKFKFCQNTVDFAGLTITPTGVTPSANTLSSICDFPRPPDLTSARSWFGLVNQVIWAHAISPIMQPFRELIKPNQKFYWDDTLDTLFESSKSVLIDLVKDGCNRTTSPEPPVSNQIGVKIGVGYLLLQKHCQCAIVSPDHSCEFTLSKPRHDSSNIGTVRSFYSGRRRAAHERRIIKNSGRRIIKNSGRRIIIYASN